jgi:hypothetical protein
MIKNEAQVELTGWLNDVKEFDWGTALKVSIDVRKKSHQGEWETVDKTTYDITTDGRTALEGVKQVTVKGRITGTSTFQKRDGSTGVAIKVRADSVTVASDKILEAAIMEVWPTAKIGPAVDEGAPF